MLRPRLTITCPVPTQPAAKKPRQHKVTGSEVTVAGGKASIGPRHRSTVWAATARPAVVLLVASWVGQQLPDVLSSSEELSTRLLFIFGALSALPLRLAVA